MNTAPVEEKMSKPISGNKSKGTNETKVGSVGNSCLVSNSGKGVALLPEQSAEEPLRMVEFKFNAPSAAKVCIAGTFNRWDTQATPLAR